MIPSVQYPVLKVPACGASVPRLFRLLPYRRSARGSTLPERLGAVKNFFKSFFPALGRSALPPVPVRPCLRAGRYITRLRAAWQSLDAILRRSSHPVHNMWPLPFILCVHACLSPYILWLFSIATHPGTRQLPLEPSSLRLSHVLSFPLSWLI